MPKTSQGGGYRNLGGHIIFFKLRGGVFVNLDTFRGNICQLKSIILKLSTFKCNKVISLICKSLLCGGCELATIIVGGGVSEGECECRCVKAKMGPKKLILEFSDLHPSSGFGIFPYQKIVLLYKI